MNYQNQPLENSSLMTVKAVVIDASGKLKEKDIQIYMNWNIRCFNLENGLRRFLERKKMKH